ncbi:DinB family protein [Roseivirga sp. BDSF3-8]|uniref:DinB family protein n=1 Tax=Roseivirga sp. BDSF3-8 TaxID=3241598 RepID=UPI003532259B
MDAFPIAEECSDSHKILFNALEGTNAHLKPEVVLEGLTARVAGQEVPGSPYTIWQLLLHLNYWQDRFMKNFLNQTVRPVAHAALGWSCDKAPESETALQKEIARFIKSLDKVKELLDDPTTEFVEASGGYGSGYDAIQSMASHCSYHLGQIMLLRQLLSAYPPPSGGFVW